MHKKLFLRICYVLAAITMISIFVSPFQNISDMIFVAGIVTFGYGTCIFCIAFGFDSEEKE